MVTITKLEQQFKDNKPNGFKINLSDGTFGYLVEKESDKGLREGDEVTFTSVTPEGKNYKKITVFKTTGGKTPSQASATQSGAPPSQPLRPAINVGVGKSKEEMKAEATIKIASLVIDAFLQGKITSDKVKETVVEYDALLWAEINEIYSK